MTPKRNSGHATFGFTAREVRAIRAMKTPQGIQKFLNSVPYHLEQTAWSPRVVLREKTAHCLEGAIFAAAAMRVLGYQPLVIDLEAHRDTDHVLAVFKDHGCWGAVATSNYAGCRYREPVHRSLRELAVSYFDVYFNLAGERTLRTFSDPVNLARFDKLDWMTTEDEVWFIPEYLFDVRHHRLLTKYQEQHLTRLDERSFRAGLHGHRTK